ncbi:Mediator of RNA polymerase II transcription subunit 12 [Paramyrothecium foliicola]|nr:Mediator of RNA polymerase II transcription subunit 12 [Paramyrothecium foliicola]
MTSRTPLGVPPRPPQRTLSNPSLSVQRPSHQQQQRTLSQQHISPSSPVRKDPVADFSGESPDVAQGRHANTPRRGGSRLRLELSTDQAMGSLAAATESPQSLTPSRMMPISDAMDAGHLSPALSRASHQDIDNPPLPLPRRRPWPSQKTKQTRDAVVPPPPTKKDLRPKPYTVEIPAAAPRFVSTNKSDTAATNRDPFSRSLFTGYADFYAWNGNHHEDEWSTEAIQKGTWDRGNQNETASARLAIFPALKQKSGLSALSTIYMGVLNHRKHRGQVTAPSTFKPPPRVTLTDTKREVWLKDLANPAISLRRLSRTIPHGIRGRTLLDQCLNKNVPTERAVWLAKCVGANEIRAFKRKGVNGVFAMGGELKWIRDWTVFVEQFVDAIVSAFGEADWKTKVTYAVRLATNLYSEHLLDRDHYLDWIMAGLENSPQSRIPMWILIAQIYWADLLRSRKHGRRLVIALLAHLDTIQKDPDHDILIQLSGRLSALLKSLVTTSSENFIGPTTWSKYKDALKASLHPDDGTAQLAYKQIHQRNSRLMVTSGTASSPAGRQQLVKLLDSTLESSFTQDLPAKCWVLSDDKEEIVRTVVEWATSPHRPGLARIYIAARLVKTWSAFRLDSTTIILGVIDHIADQDQVRKQMMYRFVTELVRSGHFSLPHYFRWLIARGGYHDADQIDPDDGPCATRLLVELPIHCLSDHWRNERGNLLRRTGAYSIQMEEQDIVTAFKCVQHTLGLPLAPDDPFLQRKPLSLRKLLTRIGNSTRALQSCIGARIYELVADQLPSKGDFVMSPATFSSIRAILEAGEDFAMLAGVLKACSKASNPEILASCADTVNSNLRVFLAIGVAEDLFEALVDWLKTSSRDHGVVARPLLAALTSLAERMPGREEIAKQLLQELIQNDRSNAIDACSPVSDNMMLQMQGSEGEVSEEIDKLLTSGNSIDPPTMNRLFRNIVPRLETGWLKKDETLRAFALLLTRLRIFDMQHFDKLVSDWVSHIRSLNQRSPLAELFPLLLSLGCLSISTLLQTANASPPKLESLRSNQAGNQASSIYLQELLHLLLTKPPPSVSKSLSPEEIYRFQIQQQAARSEHRQALLILIRNAILEYAGLKQQNKEEKLLLDEPVCQEQVRKTIGALVVADFNAVAGALAVKNLPAEARNLVRNIIGQLLNPNDVDKSETSFDQILGLANELTMPFCQLKLNLELSVAETNQTHDDAQNSSRFDLFAKAMDRAIEARNIMWTSMLPLLSDDITQHLKAQAYARFLDLMPSNKSTTFGEDAISSGRIQLAQNLLGVLESIISGQAPSKSAHLTNTLAEKLASFWEVIAAKDDADKVKAKSAILDHWLPLLLRFTTLHTTLPEVPAIPPSSISSTSKTITPVNTNLEARARIALTLCSLLLELDSLPRPGTAMKAEQIFDVAAVLVDGLPEDLRSHCARSILLLPGGMPNTTTTSDPRLYYLLSAPQPSKADNLVLSHKEKTAMPHSSAARGMGALYGIGPTSQAKTLPFVLRRWEILSEPTPNVGENDTSLNLRLFEAIKLQ